MLGHGLAAVEAAAGVIACTADDGASLMFVKSVGYPREVVEQWQVIPLTSDLLMAQAARTRRPGLESSRRQAWASREPPPLRSVSGPGTSATPRCHSSSMAR